MFLANIHPSLQLDVLNQVAAPEFIALDTMNYWIEGTPQELRRVLERVHVLVINDAEAQELSGEANLVKAARAIQAMGPQRVVIKRGEYGVLMTRDDDFFAVPAFRWKTCVTRPALVTPSPGICRIPRRRHGDHRRGRHAGDYRREYHGVVRRRRFWPRSADRADGAARQAAVHGIQASDAL